MAELMRCGLSGCFCLLLLVQTLSAQEPAAAPATDPVPESVKNITWDDLVPKGWVPPAIEIDHFFDATPPQTLSVTDTPVVAAMNGQRIRLPGYLVPLDVEGERLRSFLMVPYFGACIHVPPPPPNQVVYVEMPQAVALEDPYGAHWVTGIISTQASSTSMAEASYTLQGEVVEAFDWDAFYQQGSRETSPR